MSDEQALALVPEAGAVLDFKQSQTIIKGLMKSDLKEGVDFGHIPGTAGTAKVLMQPGAEKMMKRFGLVHKLEKVEAIEDFEKMFCFYKYKCTLIHFATGKDFGEAVRSSNSKEATYRNKNFYDLLHVVEAKAQKRALVAAVRTATMASAFFDDNQDFDEEQTGTYTKKEDPQRAALMARMFATANERGLTPEKFEELVKGSLAKKGKPIEHMTDLSNGQINSLIEMLHKTYEPVGKGNPPKKITENPQPVQPAVVEGEIIEPPKPEEKVPVMCVDCKQREAAKDDRCLSCWAIDRHRGASV